MSAGRRPRDESAMRFDDRIERFCRHLAVERGLSVHTVRGDRRDLAFFAEFLASKGTPDWPSVDAVARMDLGGSVGASVGGGAGTSLGGNTGTGLGGGAGDAVLRPGRLQ